MYDVPNMRVRIRVNWKKWRFSKITNIDNIDNIEVDDQRSKYTINILNLWQVGGHHPVALRCIHGVRKGLRRVCTGQ